MTFKFDQETDRRIGDNEAKKLGEEKIINGKYYPNQNINWKAIEQIEQHGYEVIRCLMKSNLLGFKIENQLLKYADTWKIKPRTLLSAEKFRNDNIIIDKINLSQQKYGDVNINNKADKEALLQKRVDARKRIKRVKDMFKEESLQYEQMYLFVVHDQTLNSIKERFGGRKNLIKDRIIEAINKLSLVI